MIKESVFVVPGRIIDCPKGVDELQNYGKWSDSPTNHQIKSTNYIFFHVFAIIF